MVVLVSRIAPVFFDVGAMSIRLLVADGLFWFTSGCVAVLLLRRFSSAGCRE